MKMFTIGSGFSVQAVVHLIDKWLQLNGVHANARVDNRPAAQVAHEKLSRRHGSTRFAIDGLNLFVQDGNQWAMAVHHDDIHGWLFGREVEVKVGPAPDPTEKGVEVSVGVMDVSVKAGADGKLGTKDDVVKITPKPTRPKGESEDGMYYYEEVEDEDGNTMFECPVCECHLDEEDEMIDHLVEDH